MSINVGSRFDDRITGTLGTFIPEAKRASAEGRGGIIHVDVRKSEHGKQVEPTYFVHSTGRDFLIAVNDYLGVAGGTEAEDDGSPKINERRIASNRRAWLEKMRELQAQYPVPIMTYPPETVTVERTRRVHKMPTSTRRRRRPKPPLPVPACRPRGWYPS